MMHQLLSYGYKGLSKNFDCQKAILYDMYVVQNANDKYGVINDKNVEIIGCKYENMKFDESTQEFFVTNALSKVGIILANGTNKVNIEYDEISVLNKNLYLVKNNNKYGILDKDGKIKVDVNYDEIKTLDSEIGLYIAKYNNKYGVINENNQQVIYCEYDKIGIDARSYKNDNIENENLLLNNLIPVQRNNKWGLFDIKGKEVLKCEYDGFGCIAAGSVDKIANNAIIIPECECIVVEKDKKYGIINKNGNLLIEYVLNAVYSITNSGVNTYYMSFDHNNETIEYEIPWYLEQMGLYTPNKTDEDTNINQEQTNNNESSNEINNEMNNEINNEINNETANQEQINDNSILY